MLNVVKAVCLVFDYIAGKMAAVQIIGILKKNMK